MPAWGAGTGQELRWSDQSNQGGTASAAWPFVTRPASATQIGYLYVFSADTTSLGALGGGTSAPSAFSNANYNLARWNWDAVGTFASAPIFTAYKDNTHGAITRGDNSVLGGNTTDTGSTARSYLKGNAFGRVTSAGAPAAAPANAPAITDGATGAATPTAGANWLTNYQGLQGDNDYIQLPATPAATTADAWAVMVALFAGPNLATGTYVNTLSIKYTYS